MRTTTRAVASALLAAALLGYGAGAGAWSDQLSPKDNVNTNCHFEPEAQCSWYLAQDADLSGKDLRHISFASARLDRANLKGTNLAHANFQLASLEGADLTLANLEGAHLHGVNLRGANLTMTNLKGVNLLDADLSGSNLRGANLKGAILIKARLDHATWTDGRTCAAGSVGECL
ncbi:MAG TPA: pentapeptide repeat-containing protein [Gammaproteobacteria bacterium]|nr:pentapeptide repeat-containing protein [Gammaproteobacteria bacterium]